MSGNWLQVLLRYEKTLSCLFDLNGSRLQSTEYGCVLVQSNKIELSLCIEISLNVYPECPLGKKQDLESRVKADFGFFLSALFEYFPSENTFVCLFYY